MRPTLLIVLSLLGAALAGCGGTRGATVGEELSLLLDSAPNAVHAGIYVATGRGYDEGEGVTLRVRKPRASTDAVELLRTGRADAAILDIHALGLARQQGADLVGVMALVQRPLAAVLAQPAIERPRDLEGRRAGVGPLPSDAAVLRSVVRGDGGDPARVQEVTIGPEARGALLSGRVEAATAFWNVDGVALRAARPGFQEFRVEDFGAPAYPELVLVVTRQTLEERRDPILGSIRAMQRGYHEAEIDPESAVNLMASAERRLDRDLLAAQIDAVAPAWTAGVPAFGALERKRLEAWARWDVRSGILDRRPDVDRAFAFDLVGRFQNP